MKAKFKMGKKLWINSSQKISGEYNRGTVVGIELNYFSLGYINESQYVRDHDSPRYKVAYIDVFTKQAISKWFNEPELQANKP